MLKKALFLSFIIYQGAFASPEQLSSRSQLLTNRIEACRVQLKDIERLRSRAVALGSLSAFEDLTSRARDILSSIEIGTESPELLYLIGQCQGILESLLLTLEKPLVRQSPSSALDGKRTAPSGKRAQEMVQGKTRNQFALEPLPVNTFDEEKFDQNNPAKVPHTCISMQSRKDSRSNPAEGDDPLSHSRS